MTWPPRLTRCLAGVLLVPVSLLAMAACGDDDSDVGTPDSTSTSPSGTTTVTETVTPSTDPTPDGPKNTPTGPPPSSPTESTGPSVPPVDVTRPPATYDAALYHFQQASGQRVELSRFQLPSGNLYCVVKNRYIPASCELGEGGIEDADYCGSDGPTQFIGRIELEDGQPTAICNSDTIRQPGPTTLAYGDIATASGSPVECLAEQIGVTCLDTASSQGFFLAKGNYVLLTSG